MRRVLLLLLTLPWVASASAASVTLHPNGNLVVLEGRIEVGDFDKVDKLAREASPTAIYLASPGGSVKEALRIGALVRRRAWETKTAEPPSMPAEIRAGVAASFGVRDRANNLCASACFFIFVSGIYRDGFALGIHAPHMSASELERLPPGEAMRSENSVRLAVGLFLRQMGVPPKYLDAIYEVPKEELRWLSEDEIRADFHGFVPEVREWVRTQCGDAAETLRCKNDVMTGIRIRALEQAGKDGARSAETTGSSG